jgi:hypothetical protein
MLIEFLVLDDNGILIGWSIACKWPKQNTHINPKVRYGSLSTGINFENLCLKIITKFMLIKFLVSDDNGILIGWSCYILYV